MKEVTRDECIQHLARLLVGDTDEPCTIETPWPIINTATGASAGTGNISFFVEYLGESRVRCSTVNSSLHGERVGVVKLVDVMPVLDSIHQEATRKGDTLRYVVGEKSDAMSLEKRIGVG